MHATDMYGERVTHGDKVEFEGFDEVFLVLGVDETGLILQEIFTQVLFCFVLGKDGLYYDVNDSQVGYGLLKYHS